MKFKTTLCILLLALASVAQADPVIWVINGNSYEVVTGDTTLPWDEARVLAEAMGGHLVTITSSGENDFVAVLLSSDGEGNLERYWLGGYQDFGLAENCEPANCWAWVTGEEWVYDNWEAGEPNNGVGGTQNWLHYWRTPGMFDDMENRDIMIGYIVEYEVPEPGTLLLLGAGLLGIGARRRMKAKA